MSRFGPETFTNRELSWLDFDSRVLEEARDASNPLLERVKFLAITASNLDEFFEVRVAGVLQTAAEDVDLVGPDGIGSRELLTRICKRSREFVAEQYCVWNEELRPALAAAGVVVGAQRRRSGRSTATSSGPTSTSACGRSSRRSRSTPRTRSRASRTSSSASPA